MTHREIDALVAEHVMGWTVKEFSACTASAYLSWNEYKYLGTSIHWIRETGMYRVLDESKVGCQHVAIIPRYSTDPAACKQLRDRMRELGWSYTIKTFLLWDDPHFECVFYGLRLGLEESVGTSEETAVAIAALAALGIKVAA